MSRGKLALIATIAAILLSVPVSWAVRSLMMTRGGVTAFAVILDTANDGDVEAVKPLCSEQYRNTHEFENAPEGGVAGFPRTMHSNFAAWVEGDDVLLCPTDRIGPVYRLIYQDGNWKFDGLVGLLGASGRVEPAVEQPAEPAVEEAVKDPEPMKDPQ
jgi:hypothetical protein